ncbi:MAG: pirin family protein [Alphaproteobacteria bacterium]
MSHFQDNDPECRNAAPDDNAVETLIVPSAKDIGGFEVMRALPSRERQMIGPFIFWDQMGPGEFLTGAGLDVRPHPHINLSTLTYLFDGEIMHRDSLGTEMVIAPGAVNLMTAGRGIVHSERTPDALRPVNSRLFGIQSWLALPEDLEETAPDFAHIAKEELPILEDNGALIRLVMGSAYGKTSPVPQHSKSLYIDVCLEQGASLPVPVDVEERGIYVLQGEIAVNGTDYGSGCLLVLRPKDEITITARSSSARLLVMGGDAMGSKRYIWWNFVSSRKERIEQAKQDWNEGKFPLVPQDAQEFIPLP